MSINSWKIAPVAPPYPADAAAPSVSSLSGLYPCSTKFCAVFWASSCTASIPPVVAALLARSSRPLSCLSPPSILFKLLAVGALNLPTAFR